MPLLADHLSPDWLGELQAAASGVAPQLAGSPAIVVQHEVGDPAGDVVFHVEMGPSGISVLPGPADRPTVTFTQDRSTAAAITRGELSAQTAYITGRLRVRGDVTALVGTSPALVALDDLFATVRERTTY